MAEICKYDVIFVEDPEKVKGKPFIPLIGHYVYMYKGKGLINIEGAKVLGNIHEMAWMNGIHIIKPKRVKR